MNFKPTGLNSVIENFYTLIIMPQAFYYIRKVNKFDVLNVKSKRSIHLNVQDQKTRDGRDIIV